MTIKITLGLEASEALPDEASPDCAAADESIVSDSIVQQAAMLPVDNGCRPALAR
ncbi:hypothetical protein [Rubripirellula lacrimiformis]|uniref:hypothetical protein n=1 Tax=Rubripirellula lacrimiformis TaxID=1930273 RepID=UPI001FEA8ED3|nr:hypothetical protein [Rubripirellula lacrimiformis]